MEPLVVAARSCRVLGRSLPEATQRLAASSPARLALAASFMLAFGGLAEQSVAAREQATPDPLVSDIDAEHCQISPRPVGDFLELADEPGYLIAHAQGTPVATPIPPSGGVPASADVVEAVSDTFAEYLACINANDLPRATALLTDNYFAWLFGGADEQSFAQALASPTPLPPGAGPTSFSIDDVLVYPDGRVGALTQVDAVPALTIFAEVGDRYLIDFSYEPPATGTPVP